MQEKTLQKVLHIGKYFFVGLTRPIMHPYCFSLSAIKLSVLYWLKTKSKAVCIVDLNLVCDRYDLVDLTRQVLSKLANDVYLDIRTTYQKRNVNGLNSHTQKFLELIEDIDKLLASDKNFLLGTWLESAKNLAATSKEKIQVSMI